MPLFLSSESSTCIALSLTEITSADDVGIYPDSSHISQSSHIHVGQADTSITLCNRVEVRTGYYLPNCCPAYEVGKKIYRSGR
ncbi:MAG: hypothetical protein IJ816_00225 [Alloprevotella sp.]|nr:hypothetical protein [Alloprevotella sp.]